MPSVPGGAGAGHDNPPRGSRRPPPPADSELTLAFAGDVHFEAHLRGLLEDPDAALSEVAPLLGAADVTMLNLETAITDRGAPEPKDYTFRASPVALDALAAAGVDVVSLANNHGMDFGVAGYRDTLAAKADAPLAVIGIGRDAAEAYEPYVQSVDGTRVAILAATIVPEPTTEQWAAVGTRGGLATAVDPRQLLAAVRLAATDAHLVVVYMHWGEEHVACPTNEQEKLRRELAVAGADVVLGSHAHVLLGSGWADDGTYINYGLGNFIWYHGRSEEVASTGVLTLTVRGGNVVDHGWAPARIPPSGGVPEPLDGPGARAAREQWNDLRGCARLAGEPTNLTPSG